MDALIEQLADIGVFPNLANITIVGFSAGAQFTVRYAFASPVGSTSHPPVRFIVSDASSSVP